MRTKNEKPRFTDRWLSSVKPRKPGDPDYRKYIWDDALKHFGIKPSAAPAFYVGLRSPQTQRWTERHVGDYPKIGLAAAREEARKLIAAIGGGQPLPKTGVESFAAVVELYNEACLTGRKTRSEIEANLDRAVEAFGTRPASSIKHEDLVPWLQGIASQTGRNRTGSKLRSGGPHAATKIKGALNPLFKWAAFHRHGGITTNPMAAIPTSELLRGKSYIRARDHVISDADLRILHQAALQTSYPFGPLIRCLLTSGQRLSELAEARWSEIDEDTGCLVIPGERMKNGEMHTLPLTEGMRLVLAELPRFAAGDYLFSTTLGRKPISGFSQFKMRFDRRVADLGRVEPWQLHDLRRTVRTGLSRAGVLPVTAELVVAHRQGGVHAVYDLHRYHDEKLAALQRWEGLLARILAPIPDNVVVLAG